MNRKKHLYSKVFDGYNFDIGIDRDFQHQKALTGKIQQTKQVQQKKQIDKMFQGIVKQRIFGTMIAERSRLSKEGFFKIDRINRTINGSFRSQADSSQTAPTSPECIDSLKTINTSRANFSTARKKTLQPLNLTSYNSIQKKKQSFSIDQSTILQRPKRISFKDIPDLSQTELGSRTPQLGQKQKGNNYSVNLTFNKLPSNQRTPPKFKSKPDLKSIPTTKSIAAAKYKRKQSTIMLKQMNLDDNDPFQQHFKKLSNSQNIFLYDIKVNKQTIAAKTRDRVNPRLLDYFFYFFGFPSVMTFRQFKKGIEKAFNSPLSLIYFFTFRVLDESGNGFLTISDLFRFLEKYPETHYIEKEIFNMRKKINEISQDIMKTDDEKKHIKPSLQEILIVNHKLKADEVSQLLKQSIKQEINKGGQVKLTCYSQSILSLEHDVAVRLKQYELENQKNESQAMNAKNIEKDNILMNQDGLRFTQFIDIFKGHRPKIFCLLVNILTGLNNSDYE